MVRRLVWFLLTVFFAYFAMAETMFGASTRSEQGAAPAAASRVPLYFESNPGPNSRRSSLPGSGWRLYGFSDRPGDGLALPQRYAGPETWSRRGGSHEAGRLPEVFRDGGRQETAGHRQLSHRQRSLQMAYANPHLWRSRQRPGISRRQPGIPGGRQATGV